MMSNNEELSTQMLLELTDILLCCNTCEIQALELLKIANCIFSQEACFDLLELYTEFNSNLQMLQSLMLQMGEFVTTFELITIKLLVNELEQNFTQLVKILTEADRRIDDESIDFELAGKLSWLLDIVDFDVVDFETFTTEKTERYFVVQQADNAANIRDWRYGDLKVLQIQPFATRCEAYLYALKHGISKDLVFSRH